MTSVKTTASMRRGKSAGARLLRHRATGRARTSTTTSTTRKIFTSSQNPRRTSGNDSRNTAQSKNVLCTSDHPGLVTMSSARPPSTTTDDSAAIAAPRRARRRRAASRTRRASDAAVSAGEVLR